MSRRERRDMFAAAALQGLLAGDSGDRTLARQIYRHETPRETAELAADIAIALLAELDRRDEEAQS